ncbi:uncharacterized protein LOC117917359 [Vitis riparia]|uniref:uncharacterized protein LOC117917359 n=1 Tax=Vitis riparia TaxID=96939 RepID=UPI00155A27CD|nr:uncharacterized protein LOC117917359 [Vitis riparia]
MQRLLRVASTRERISFIQSGLADGGMRPIDGVITFPSIDPNRVLQPHQDAFILTLGINDFDIGFPPFALENPGRILSGFNGVSTTSLGYVMLPVQAEPVILNVQFSVVEDLSPFNAIMGCTWLHGMKVIPSTYHQVVSYVTEDGKINFYGSQLAARQCYQVAHESIATGDNEPSMKPADAVEQ